MRISLSIAAVLFVYSFSYFTAASEPSGKIAWKTVPNPPDPNVLPRWKDSDRGVDELPGSRVRGVRVPVETTLFTLLEMDVGVLIIALL